MKHRNLKRLFSLVAVWIYVCCCAGCGKPNVQTNNQMDSRDQAEMKTIRILGVDLSAENTITVGRPNDVLRRRYALL